jgi:hypothetical protein
VAQRFSAAITALFSRAALAAEAKIWRDLEFFRKLFEQRCSRFVSGHGFSRASQFSITIVIPSRSQSRNARRERARSLQL